MSMVERIESLKMRHAALERSLHDEEVRPYPDEDIITELKKRKLRIKDELASLEFETHH